MTHPDDPPIGRPEWRRAIRAVVCPDCGPVEVRADVWDGPESISGECPKCGDRLYFARPLRDGEP